MHGLEGITAVYYLPGPRPAIIEAGPGSSIEATTTGLEEAGVDDLDWIVLTHIHLDHAGAVGHLAARYPKARVIVREEGARHLVDPSRLWASASRIYPDMEGLWGSFLPVEESRITPVSEDGIVADLGDGRRLQAIYAPGHANHHMAILESATGDLFTGDAMGVYFSAARCIRPATPPPEFNLLIWLQTLEHIKHLQPSRIFPTHFGPFPDPEEALVEAPMRLRQWTEAAELVVRSGGDASAVADKFRQMRDEWYPDLDSALLIDKFEQTTSYEMNASGIYRYLTRSETSK